MLRKIIQIDENLCNGCGECVTACAEGAIQIINGKARLVSETYCDGLGACLGECPVGAITIEEREAEAFDEEAVQKHLHALQTASQPSAGGCPGSQARVLHPHVHASAPAGGCPGAQARVLSANASAPAAPSNGAPARPSALRQWPVQLHLVSPQAPYFHDCDLLIAADCVAFAMGNFHERLLEGRSVAIACPKLDNAAPYVQKLATLFAHNNIRSITVAIMEVPCCRGLEFLVEQALKASGKNIPLTLEVISLDGTVKASETRNLPEGVAANR